jgi:hypothetical protein
MIVVKKTILRLIKEGMITKQNNLNCFISYFKTNFYLEF